MRSEREAGPDRSGELIERTAFPLEKVFGTAG